jgi:hypothetical protein
LTPPTEKLVATLLTIETQCSKAQGYIKNLLQLDQQQKHTQKAQELCSVNMDKRKKI